MKKDYDKPDMYVKRYRVTDTRIMDGDGTASAMVYDTGTKPSVQYTLGSLSDLNS